ncbi:MAG: chromate transporter [Candidatus Riflebacteria bacterium HGW-Riflebacteria-1]|jgi:chromate transporter|nr:MAG: chromate transporter [Candidatus Riflebacteria bacterium HGW-Riflebacteria-1]
MTDFCRLREVAGVFFKLGIMAFGGPAAHIAMMQEEVVQRRQWMTEQQFLDLVGVTNLIPGPNSTEMAIHCGYIRAGAAGLLLAGICFIIPAVLLTGLIAWFYAQYGALPDVEPFFFGIKAAVLVIICNAVITLGRKAVSSRMLAGLGLVAIILSLLGLPAVAVILGLGVVGMINRSPAKISVGALMQVAVPILGAGSAVALPAVAVTTSHLFLVFLKIGAVLFGSGYVLVAFLNDELVHKLGWLTPQVLMDSIAIGQFTPGPVLSTATFVGYQIAGIEGAAAATIGIFLPSFFFVLLLNPVLPYLRRSPAAARFLDAVNVASVGLMAAVILDLGYGLAADWRLLIIAIGAFAMSYRWKKLNAAWVVIWGSLAGYLLRLI